METKEFALSVTEQEIQIISAGLGELPFKAVAGLIQKLQQQINDQVQGVSNEEIVIPDSIADSM